LICQEKDQKQLVDKLQKIKGIKYIVNSQTVGTRLTKKYVF